MPLTPALSPSDGVRVAAIPPVICNWYGYLAPFRFYSGLDLADGKADSLRRW